MRFLIFLGYLMIGLIFLLAAEAALEHDEDRADSIMYPLAMFWPLSIVGLSIYLLIRASGVLEADHQGQERKRAARAAKSADRSG